MTKKFKIQLLGATEDNEHIRLSDFIEELNAVREALQEIDRRFYGDGNQTTEYRIVDLSHSSPSAVVVEPVPIDKDKDNAAAIVDRLLDGIRKINTGTAPADFDSRLLEKVSHIARPYKKRVRQVQIIDDNGPIIISQTFEASIERIVGDDQVSDGSVDGSLEMINFHRGANKFNIYPTVGPDRVACHFPGDLLEKAIASVGRYVRVSGKLKHKTRDRFLYGIEVESVEALPDEASLPSFQELRGIAPDFTGGLTSEEFVRRLRDG